MGALNDLVSAVLADVVRADAATADAGTADAGTLRVDDVVVGVHWTAVRGPSTGLAATQLGRRCCAPAFSPDPRRFDERSMTELLALTGSADPLEVSVGVAALNCMLTTGPGPGVGVDTDLDAVDLILERGRDHAVVMVGHFPATPALRRSARSLRVLEQDPGPGDDPAGAAADLLPRADVIGITATTLINGTFDELARLFPPTALVVMLGPSTPLTPLLFDHGVDVLAGVVVTDPDELMRRVAQGASRRQLRGLRRATVIRDSAGRAWGASA